MSQCHRAFTLAETLIVIGIIGVVAALTLPNLNHATGDKEKVTRVKKIYSSLTDAFDRAQVIYGDADEWFVDFIDSEDYDSMSERAAKRITEFMKVSKDCGFEDGCWASAPLLNTQGDEYFSNYLEELKAAHSYMLMLSDGTSLAFKTISGFQIKVDIDGPNKGKNQLGNDIFSFSIGLHDTHNTSTTTFRILHPYLQLIPDTAIAAEDNDFFGNSTAWVIQNGNLDYLKCPDELNWETQTSCK